MNGRKAKARRRAEAPTVHPATTGDQAGGSGVYQHPLGPHAGVYTAWERNLKVAMLREIEKERARALQEPHH